jgi:DNA-directed RNA polymerase
MQGQIEHALNKLDEHGPYLDAAVSRHDASVYMAGIIWDAIGDIVVAARSAMTWLKQVSDVLSSAGLPIRWTSPIGFPVLQEYHEQVGKRIEVHMGGQRLQLTLVSDLPKLAPRRQKAGIAPNFVHSLDSAHLISTVNLGLLNGLDSFAVIHDSFATHACDVSMLNAVLREAFVEQYRGNLLEDFRNEVIEQLEATAPELVEKIPPVPPMGKLDIEAVKDSDFFFA